MTWLEKIRAVRLLPSSRKHICLVMKQLTKQSCDSLLQQRYHINKKTVPLNATVQAYFWAARTIKNCHCLPRSIALYQKLRSSGYQVEHKFGIDEKFDSNRQDQKLAAHSWVEYQNKPLNESPDLKQRFKVLEKV